MLNESVLPRRWQLKWQLKWQLLTGVAIIAVGLPCRAEIVFLSGFLDNLQVVAPVYDPPGDPNGTVVGSTSVKPNGDPISTSKATGFATITIDTIALTMITDFQWSGLTGPADRAHVHDAPSGVTRLLDPPNDRFFHEVINFDYDFSGSPPYPLLSSTVAGGPVLCTNDMLSDYYDPTPSCAPATGSLQDVLDLDSSRWEPFGTPGGSDGTLDDMIAVFKEDGMFIDIHTEAYPGGEIRGQLLYTAVPEPGSGTLLGLALAGVAAMRLRRRA